MSKIDETFPGGALLIPAGYTTRLKVEQASDDELLAVEGVGPATLEKIRGWKPEDTVNGPQETTPVTGDTGERDPAYACANRLCGHQITSYPCPYCGFTG